MSYSIRKLLPLPRRFRGLLGTANYGSANIQQVESSASSYEMKAWQIDSFGSLEKLQKRNAPKPVITRPNDILVRVTASSVNPLDVAMIGGYGNVLLNTLKQVDFLCSSSQQFPLTLGRDFTGEVVAKGNAVGKSFRVGDVVYGVVPPHLQGCHAEEVVVSDSLLALKPNHLNSVETSGIMYAGMTAWSALMLTGDLIFISPKDKTVLVCGGSGGVGTYAIQMLKAWGAKVVSTCSTDAIPLVESLKADIVIDYTQPEAIKNIEASGKYDIILDATGHLNPMTYVPFLKDWHNSKFITLRSPMLKNTDDLGLVPGMVRNAQDFITSNLSSGAPTKGSTVRWGFFVPFPKGIRDLSTLVENKQIKPIIDSVYHFDDLPDAYKKVSQGHLRGKVILSMNGEGVTRAPSQPQEEK